MCGRFVVDDTVWGEVERLIGWLDRSRLVSGDVFPSQQILILRKKSGYEQELSFCMAHWGYPGYGGGREIINARAETVQEKPSFRADFAQRRCVIPAKGFYEWNPKKEKFYFSGQQPQGGKLRRTVLYLAGIYSNDPGRERVTILTTGANASMRPVHDRMPLLLSEEEITGWVGQGDLAARLLKKIPPDLKREKQDGGYEQLSLF